MNFVIKKKSAYSFFLALFATFIIVLIPWDTLRSSEYVDRANYVSYIDHTVNKTLWFDYDTLLSKISFEWGWHKLLYIATENGLNSSHIFMIVSSLIMFFSIFLVITRTKYYGFLFLINPVFIDFCFSQMRLAFTMSLVYLAYILYKRKNILYIPILLSTPFFHTSAVIFIGVFLIATKLEQWEKLNFMFKNTVAIMVGLVLAIVTGPLMSQILGQLGDRRAEYEDMSSPVLYMSFWVIYFVYLAIKAYTEKLERNAFFYISLIILGMVFFNVFFSGYSSRFLAACFPIIIIALLQLKSREKQLLILGYAIYTLMLWFFWAT
ncbi:EpsG family protein [Acinetobacter baumannii]|uniref:EpsG family protein n=2 Tax=Acinetobacter baumannii TaxID=470 RepID=UPI000450AEC3|nr:EpsG family protein [Acinetobacter baumannii]EIW4105272.1 EpsG family protein [Acinetobacter baumannii]EJD6467846.1 EpsG family protein [Acinetobacter baumannii]EJF1104348.1 EpsG family protein [Acinetobacter baumannii]EKT8216745.1 EpsG family protein [Acinetobacter baumannii]EKT8552786.1 EpsG family protein [Acinetobacter baumannii]